MANHYFFHRLPAKYLRPYLFGVLLSGLAAGASAGDIAGTPLVAYSSGGHDLLVILSNTSSMGTGTLADVNGNPMTYFDASNQTISQLLTDTTTVAAKTTASGQLIGLGLMSYGGTRLTSPYTFGSVSPYTTNASEFNDIAFYDGYTVYSFPACNDDTLFAYSYPPPGGGGDPSHTLQGFYYSEADPTSQPYCLPRSYPRYYLADDGSCTVNPSPSTTLFSTPINPSSTCGDAPPSAPRTNGMGYLRVPVQQLPLPTTSNAPSLASTFLGAVTVDNTVGNAIEGALLTACDYYNTSFSQSYTQQLSQCYRGYPPYITFPPSALPVNVFGSSNPGDSQGITASTPVMPNACDAAVVWVTDRLQDTTADGLAYTPDFTTLEELPWVTGSVIWGGDTTARFYTDPVNVAINNLYYRNTGIKVRTFIVGLGFSSATDITNLNKLAVSGSYLRSTPATAYYPTDVTTLKTALDNIFADTVYTPMSIGQASASSAAINSASLQTDTLVFQGQFAYNNQWYGDLSASPIDSSNVTAGYPVWSAAWNLLTNPLTAYPNRHIYSYDPAASTGINFSKTGLNSSQLAALSNIYDSVDNLLRWVQGDFQQEAPNGNFRARNGNMLGDIVNSDPVYSGAENYAYDVLPGAEGSSYASFLANTKATRQAMVYLGANDGMFHGFNVGTSPNYADGGVEQFAYMPNAVIPNLLQYAAPPAGGTYYPHVYMVDGPPSISDAFLGGAWKSVLVGTTGAGGQAIFALDVTNPSSFASSNPVLWEISDSATQAYVPNPNTSAGVTEQSAVHGDLGYTLGQPAIVRLNNGQWGAIVANGYNSANGKAVLFIFNLADGSLIAKIDTGAAGNVGSVIKNGLSAPIAIDIDGNRTADSVYAGDLEGNLWKFDLSSAVATHWAVANGGAPLFVACAPPFSSPTASCDPVANPAYRQPITAKPNVGPGVCFGAKRRRHGLFRNREIFRTRRQCGDHFHDASPPPPLGPDGNFLCPVGSARVVSRQPRPHRRAWRPANPDDSISRCQLSHDFDDDGRLCRHDHHIHHSSRQARLVHGSAGAICHCAHWRAGRRFPYPDQRAGALRERDAKFSQ